jgi:hypothetical protein
MAPLPSALLFTKLTSLGKTKMFNRLLLISCLILLFHSSAFSKKKWPPKFSDYLIDSVYQGEIANPDFSSNKPMKRFRTVIRSDVEYARESGGVTFAGHFIICEWGCGSPCQNNVIVDAITGRIYDGITTCWSYNSRPNSRLLIANPDSANIYESFCPTEYYLWDNDRLIKIKK